MCPGSSSFIRLFSLRARCFLTARRFLLDEAGMSCGGWFERLSWVFWLECLRDFPSAKACMVVKDFPLTAKLNIKALLELAAASCAFGLISLVRLFVLDTCTVGEFFEELAFFLVSTKVLFWSSIVSFSSSLPSFLAFVEGLDFSHLACCFLFFHSCRCFLVFCFCHH